MSTSNAEASSSRAGASILSLSRVKSRKARKDGHNRLTSIASTSTAQSANMPYARPTSPPPSGLAPERKVRTMPPSATYDPPTPPSPPHIPLPDIASPAGPAVTTPRPKRPRPKIRYSTSGESDSGSDSSDEEPPWWTFTNRGMAKLQQRSMRRKEGPLAASEVEGRVGSSRDGEEGPADASVLALDTGEHKKGRRRFVPSRKSSRNSDSAGSGLESRSISQPKPQRQSSHPQKSSPLKQHASLAPAAPIRSRSAFAPDLHIWRRQSGGRTPDEASDSEIPRRRTFQRSNSAPGSPMPLDIIIDSPRTISSIVVPPPTHASAQPVPIAPVSSDPTGPYQAKRQMTTPSFPRFRKLRSEFQSSSGGNVSDSEAHMREGPRARAKVRLNSMMLGRPMVSTPTSDSQQVGESPGGAGSGPEQPRPRRLNSQMLKVHIAEPISQHFAKGWPHAGSWQDALYGYYEDDETGEIRAVDGSRPRTRRATTKMDGNQSEKEKEKRQREKSGETLVAKNSREEGQATKIVSEPVSLDPKADTVTAPSTRRKTRRTRRYRQALIPPTPKGLGFEPRERDGRPSSEQDENDTPVTGARWKEGRVDNGYEFDWAHPTAASNRKIPSHAAGTILEADELSRTQTRMTEINTEKSDSLGKGKQKKRKVIQTGRTKRQGEDWKVRWKRMMFLDARLTILLRAWEIAVVATLLGLSVNIRQSLITLRLPGLIGPSTTLTISFASFTLFHALTAIYREYFGKPIGLWALRSKMLWVCLDLLFVALWASTLSLATNDYISTPLECTRDDPWWLGGLRSSYSQLLEDLAADPTSTGVTVTSADLVKATLGIVLPEQIIQTPLARNICRQQSGCIALSLMALLLYASNMVLSLFRIFETVRRSANVGKAIMV